MLNRVAEHDWVTAVPSPHAHRRFVGMFVILNVGQWHPLRFEGVTKLSIQQLDRNVVACPHFGELIEELVPIFPGALVDQVLATTLPMLCHSDSFAPGGARDKRYPAPSAASHGGPSTALLVLQDERPLPDLSLGHPQVAPQFARDRFLPTGINRGRRPSS